MTKPTIRKQLWLGCSNIADFCRRADGQCGFTPCGTSLLRCSDDIYDIAWFHWFHRFTEIFTLFHVVPPFHWHFHICMQHACFALACVGKHDSCSAHVTRHDMSHVRGIMHVGSVRRKSPGCTSALMISHVGRQRGMHMHAGARAKMAHACTHVLDVRTHTHTHLSAHSCVQTCLACIIFPSGGWMFSHDSHSIWLFPSQPCTP